jgi:choline dehydrogenase-like flavoprotein
MEPYYDLAEQLIGIAGAPASGLPPLRFNKAAKRIADALERVGSEVRVLPTPMAINSARHMGRKACRNSGLCQEYACRYEAKSDARVTLLRAASETGNLTIQPMTFVRKFYAKEGRVAAVECVVGTGDGARVEQLSAPVIVVACEAIESVRLLLASGLGNPDVLGRYLMFHVTGGARSLAPEPTTTWDTAPHTAYINAFYHHTATGDRPFLKAGILLPSSVGGPLQEGRKYWGKAAQIFFNEVYPFKMDLSYIGEGMPTRYNRVELAEVKDRYEMRGTRISYRPHPFDLNAGAYAAARCKEILSAAGGLIEDTAPDHLRPFLFKETTAKRLFHCTGGARFGEDPATSVLDSECRVHGLENLFVADGSFMPTGGGANPTLTIQANALRVGDIIAARLQRTA